MLFRQTSASNATIQPLIDLQNEAVKLIRPTEQTSLEPKFIRYQWRAEGGGGERSDDPGHPRVNIFETCFFDKTSFYVFKYQ